MLIDAPEKGTRRNKAMDVDADQVMLINSMVLVVFFVREVLSNTSMSKEISCIRSA